VTSVARNARFEGVKRSAEQGYALTPTPPLVKPRKKLKALPVSAVNAVYEYLVDQAYWRAKAVKDHILTGRPTLEEMSWEFHAVPRVIELWIRQAREVWQQKGEIGVPTPQAFRPEELVIPKGVTYFASGSEDSPGTIHGMAKLGIGVGVTVENCRAGSQCYLAVKQLKRGKAPVFVDSGAFSEVAFDERSGKLRLVPGKEITHEEWLEILSAYEDFVQALGGRVYLVAPDLVGSQEGTRKRMKRYAPQVREAARHGAKILVPVQRGRKSGAQFYKEMLGILKIPTAQAVAAIPMKKGAASLEDLEEFLRSARKLKAIHLLGVGPGRKDISKDRAGTGSVTAEEVIARVRQLAPRVKISCDSVLVKRGVGRGFLSVDPEVYTYAQDLVRYELMHEAFQKSYIGGLSLENWIENVGWDMELVPDYTDNIVETVNAWLPGVYRRMLADHVGRDLARTYRTKFGKAERELLLKDPEDWLRSPIWPDEPGRSWYDDPTISQWLDEQWAHFLAAYYAAAIKRDAIERAWKVRSAEAMKRALPVEATERAIQRVMFAGFEGSQVSLFAGGSS